MVDSESPMGRFGPVVELVLGLVDLVLVTVLRAQELLVHLVDVGDPRGQVVHLRLQRLKPAGGTKIPLHIGLKEVFLTHRQSPFVHVYSFPLWHTCSF